MVSDTRNIRHLKLFSRKLWFSFLIYLCTILDTFFVDEIWRYIKGFIIGYKVFIVLEFIRKMLNDFIFGGSLFLLFRFSFPVIIYIMEFRLWIGGLFGHWKRVFSCCRMSPSDWENPHPCNQNPEELENTWDLKNCLWFSLGSIMAQGCDILPKWV